MVAKDDSAKAPVKAPAKEAKAAPPVGVHAGFFGGLPEDPPIEIRVDHRTAKILEIPRGRVKR